MSSEIQLSAKLNIHSGCNFYATKYEYIDPLFHL